MDELVVEYCPKYLEFKANGRGSYTEGVPGPFSTVSAKNDDENKKRSSSERAPLSTEGAESRCDASGSVVLRAREDGQNPDSVIWERLHPKVAKPVELCATHNCLNYSWDPERKREEFCCRDCRDGLGHSKECLDRQTLTIPPLSLIHI